MQVSTRFKMLAGMLCGVLAACSQPPPHDYVAADGQTFPRVLYADGDISHNDRCPVRKNKLNRHMDPLFVNGEPVGFC